MTERYELAQRLAEATLRLVGMGARAPINAYLLANRLGIEVCDMAMEEEGRLCPGRRPVTVLLRADRPEARRRFTLCHELAHELVRSDLAGARLTESARQASHDEEYLCDKVAGALLMPRDWIRSFRSMPRTLSTVELVASRAGVSQSAALVRLRDELRWRDSLFEWKRYRGRWVLAGEAGLYPKQLGLLRTTEGTRLQLTKASAGQYDPDVDALPVQFGCEEIDLRAEVWAGSDRALALARVPYPSQPRRRATRAPAERVSA